MRRFLELVRACVFAMIIGPECAVNGQGLVVKQIADQRFCKGVPGAVSNEQLAPTAITLRILVHMSLLNHSEAPLIVPLYYEYAELVVRVLARSSLSKGNLRVIRYPAHEAPYDELPTGVSSDVVFEKWFVTIGPHQSRDDIVVWLVLPLDAVPASENLRGRRISLQPDLSFDVLTPKLSRDLAAKWQQFGTLWTGRVRSDAIVVEVPRSPKIADCSHLYHVD